MFEHHRAPLLPRPHFWRRLARSTALAAAIVFGSLAVGVAGYRIFLGLGWIDSLLNAAMILTDMGPVDRLEKASAAGKVFAAAYALFSGVAFLTVVAVLLAPVVHRFLHRFHLEWTDDLPGGRRGR